MNNYILITLDSCRFDSVSCVWSDLQSLPALGPLQEAYTFATWTHPAHLNYMTGRLPWVLDREASHPLRTGGHEFHNGPGLWQRRLGAKIGPIVDDGFRIEPNLKSLGYQLQAIVSARPIGPNSHFAGLFDKHTYVGRHGDTLLRAMDFIDFSYQPTFLLLNLCETHYPYFNGSYSPKFENRWVPSLRRQARAGGTESHRTRPVFSESELRELHERQKSSVRYVDSLLPRLFSRLPASTFLTVTADHGECFGESGQFGHGEVFDPAVLRVPFVEGPLPS